MNLTKIQTGQAITIIRFIWWTLSIEEKRGLIPVYKQLILLRETYQEPDAINRICKRFGVERAKLSTKCRKREIVNCRHLIWWKLKGKMSYTEMGAMFNKDHSTVSAAYRKINGVLELPRSNKDLYNMIMIVEGL